MRHAEVQDGQGRRAEPLPVRRADRRGRNGLSAQVSDWASAPNTIAAAHPKTAGALGLVLSDPVGFTIELNDLRLRRYSLALTELEKPDNVHALNSSNALMGLKPVMLDGNLARGWDTVAFQGRERGQFKDIGRVRANPRGWPEGTRWEPLPDTRENRLKYGHGQGRVVFPDHEERRGLGPSSNRSDLVAHDQVLRRGRPPRIDIWTTARNVHFKPLEAFELDWLGARQSPAFKRVFARHYDLSDPNNPRMAHRPGLIYAAEVEAALTPAALHARQGTDAVGGGTTKGRAQPRRLAATRPGGQSGRDHRRQRSGLWAQGRLCRRRTPARQPQRQAHRPGQGRSPASGRRQDGRHRRRAHQAFRLAR